MTWLIPDVQSLGRVAVLMGGAPPSARFRSCPAPVYWRRSKPRASMPIHLTLRINHCLN